MKDTKRKHKFILNTLVFLLISLSPLPLSPNKRERERERETERERERLVFLPDQEFLSLGGGPHTRRCFFTTHSRHSRRTLRASENADDFVCFVFPTDHDRIGRRRPHQIASLSHRYDLAPVTLQRFHDRSSRGVHNEDVSCVTERPKLAAGGEEEMRDFRSIVRGNKSRLSTGDGYEAEYALGSKPNTIVRHTYTEHWEMCFEVVHHLMCVDIPDVDETVNASSPEEKNISKRDVSQRGVCV